MKKSIHKAQYAELLKGLKKAREASALSQTELAHALGTTQSFVSKFERGERRLDVLELAQICRVLKVNLSEFTDVFVEPISSSKVQKKGGRK